MSSDQIDLIQSVRRGDLVRVRYEPILTVFIASEQQIVYLVI